jgi:hypothetical protein
MHIKHIHDMVEKLSEFAKCELDKGIEQVDTKEMGEVAEIIKELSEAEYYAKISKAMDEAEYGEDYDYMGAYDEHSRKGYRGQRRDSRGRYMSRRGYETPMMMYDDMDYESMEHMRDMDRPYGRMGYAGSGSYSGHSSSGMNSESNMGNSGSSSSGGNRGNSESRYDRARRGYEETKEMHKGNSSEDKQHKIKSLEEYMKELSEDVTSMIEGMSPEEKTLAKTKLQSLAQKIQ